MKIKIRTADFHLSMPVPVSMIGFIVKLLPDRIFQNIGADVPAPYNSLITKYNISMILSECQDILKGNRGLEAVHVEAQDGTFISIKL